MGDSKICFNTRSLFISFHVFKVNEITPKRVKLFVRRLTAVGFARSKCPSFGHRHKMVLCSQFEYPICNCVHNYSTFASSDVILKHELNSDNKAMDCPGTNQNGVHTGTPVPDFCTRVLTPCPNSCLGACKRGVFTLVPSEYSNRAPSGNAALD